jgi:hypothetical protein
MIRQHLLDDPVALAVSESSARPEYGSRIMDPTAWHLDPSKQAFIAFSPLPSGFAAGGNSIPPFESYSFARTCAHVPVHLFHS